MLAVEHDRDFVIMAARRIMAACAVAVLLNVAAGAADAESYSYTLIKVPGAFTTQASGINDSGVVAGSYEVFRLIMGSDVPIFHGFTFDRGTFSIIDPPGSASTTVTGIANDGTVIGTYIPVLNSAQKNGFILKNGVYEVFG